MRKTRKFTRISKLIAQVENLREKRGVLQSALTETDAKLADLELEWADLQKDISNTIFGRNDLDEADVKRSTPKKSHAAKRKSSKKRKDLGSRAEIQTAAKKRDARLISILKKAKQPYSIHDLHTYMTGGTRGVPSSVEQVRTSIKRMRKWLKRTGNGKSARYTLKGK